MNKNAQSATHPWTNKREGRENIQDDQDRTARQGTRTRQHRQAGVSQEPERGVPLPQEGKDKVKKTEPKHWADVQEKDDLMLTQKLEELEYQRKMLEVDREIARLKRERGQK